MAVNRSVGSDINSVSFLKDLNFGRLTLAEKVKIKSKGRHTPDLSITSPGTSKGKVYIRKFNNDLYQKHDWLTGCNERNSLFCFPCLLFGSDSVWTNSGMQDLHHLQEKIKKHESSVKHVNNVIDLSFLGKANIVQRLDTGFQVLTDRHNAKVKQNRAILSRIINCIKFCGKYELPLRGHDETAGSAKPGVFRGLLELLSEYDSTLKNHLESNSFFKRTSKTIQDELLDSMLHIYQQTIECEIKDAAFLSVMIDETTDNANMSQVDIVFRYVHAGSGKVVERFWEFFNPPNLTAETLSALVINVLERLIGSYSQKVCAQTYDGAAVLSGIHSGVQTRVKEVYPNAHFLHCYAHQLNLILQKAASQNKRVRVFFSNSSTIPAFFSKSPQRVTALNNVLQGRRTSIPRPSTTRWNFKSRTVNKVFELKDAILQCCDQLEESRSGDTGSTAGGIKRLLADLEFLFWLEFFSKIMPHIDILYNQLQARDIDATKTAKCIQSFKSSVQAARDACCNINVADNADRPRYSGERSVAAKEVCDVILLQCQERFSFTGHLLASQLFDVARFEHYTHNFPMAQLESTVMHYPMLDKQKLLGELAVLHSWQDLVTFKSLSEFLQLLGSLNLTTTTFCEITKLLNIIITTPMTTAESERCFSTFKRIKTFLRTTMGNDRLSALAMLSIESQLVDQMKDFNEKVIDHFSTSKIRRMDFIYK